MTHQTTSVTRPHQRSRVLPALLLTGLMATLTGCGMARGAHGDGGDHSAMYKDKAMHSGMSSHAEKHSHEGSTRMQNRMAERTARHMAELKTQLNITAAQAPAWNTFAAALQAPAGRMGMGAAHMGDRNAYEALSKLPTPERLERMHALHAQHMAEMNATMNQHAQAVKAFYAVLSPEQQKVFDERFMRSMRSHSKHRGHHG